MDEEGTLTLAKQGGITFVGRIVSRVLGFAFVIVITRLVDPETFGVFTLGLAIVSFAFGFASLNIHRSIDYFVPAHLSEDEYGKAKGVLTNAYLLGIVGGLVGAVLIALAASWLADTFDEPALAVAMPALSVAIPLVTVNRLLLASFNSIKKMKYRVYARDLIQPSGRLLFTGGLLLAGWGLTGLVAGHLLALLLASVAGGLLLVRNTPWIRDADTEAVSRRSLMSYSFPLMFAGVIYTVVGQIDFFVLGYFRSSAEVGVYKVAFLFASNLLIILRAFTPVFKPMIAERKEESAVLQDRYRLATRWITMLTMPIALTVILAPRTYLSILFTTDYAVAGGAVFVLGLGYLLHSAVGPEGMVLEGLGYTRLTLFNTVVLVVANTVLNVLLVPELGIIGAAIATAVATGVTVVAGVVEIYYLVGIHPLSTSLGKIWLAGVPAAIAGSALTTAVESEVVLALALPVLIGGAFLASLLLFGSFTEDDQKIARNVSERTNVDVEYVLRFGRP